MRTLDASGERRIETDETTIRYFRAQMTRAREGLPSFAQARAQPEVRSQVLSEEEAARLRALGYAAEPGVVRPD